MRLYGARTVPMGCRLRPMMEVEYLVEVEYSQQRTYSHLDIDGAALAAHGRVTQPALPGNVTHALSPCALNARALSTPAATPIPDTFHCFCRPGTRVRLKRDLIQIYNIIILIISPRAARTDD